MRLVHRARDRLRHFATVAGLCRAVATPGTPAYVVALARALRLCRRQCFEPAEAFRLGLFQPGSLPPSMEFVSRRQVTKIQEALNPAAWASLLKNKDLFYRYCTEVGVPIPRFYAVSLPGLPGWTANGQLLRTRDDWMAFFEQDLPAEFAVKPAEGAYGRGFDIFRRTPEGYLNAAGSSRQAGDLYDMLVAGAGERYIIQERLRSHPELTRLSGTEALQTVRLITLVADGRAHILHGHLKVIEKDEVVDTLLCGLAGNIEAPVDLQHGTLKTANRVPGTGTGVIAIPTHPRTRVAFDGFALPFWTEACHLTKQAALRFTPVRTIGWDVALTPDGPVMVEGNVWWDPPNQHGNMGELLKVLRDPISLRNRQ